MADTADSTRVPSDKLRYHIECVDGRADTRGAVLTGLVQFWRQEIVRLSGAVENNGALAHAERLLAAYSRNLRAHQGGVA